MDTTTRHEFKGKINGLAQQSAKIRRNILRSKGDHRNDLWLQKRWLGTRTRHVLLAYAYLRGIPYTTVEPKTAKDNPPDVHLIYLIVQETLGKYYRWDYTQPYQRDNHTLLTITSWFVGTELTWESTHNLQWFRSKPKTVSPETTLKKSWMSTVSSITAKVLP